VAEYRPYNLSRYGPLRGTRLWPMASWGQEILCRSRRLERIVLDLCSAQLGLDLCAPGPIGTGRSAVFISPAHFR